MLKDKKDRRLDRKWLRKRMIFKEMPGPGPEQEFRSYLSEGRFMIQRSRSSGRYVYFPRVAEPGSGRSDLEWVEASGFGTVHSITVNRTREGSYNIALIELAEGPRLMSRVEGVETVPIGTRVKARITEIDGEPAVVFDVVREGGAA